MAIKLTKNELKKQKENLKQFERYLPTLQLKKQQLQCEIAGIAAKADEVAERERAARASLESWIGLLASDEDLTDGLVKVTGVNTGSANIAGVVIPTFLSIDVETRPIDPWATPAWADNAVTAAKSILALKCERAIYDEQRRLVQEELRLTSQRVNLFEKVKIPECKEAIRVIKIALGDEQTAAVTRGKIATGRDKT